MKKPFSVCFILFLSVTSFAQVGTMTFTFTKSPKAIIQGNKIIKEEVYSYNFNKRGITDSVLNTTYYYNSLGDFVEQALAKTRKHEEVITKFENSYNSLGKLHKQKVHNQSQDLVMIYQYGYDSIGNEVIQYQYNEDTTTLTVEKKIYNTKNQIVELQTRINNNDIYVSRLYYYNAHDELAETEAFDTKGKVMYSDIYEYDKILNKKTVYRQNADGKKKTEEYFYNADKQPVRVNSVVEKTAFIIRESIEFEKVDKVTEHIYNADKTVFESNVYLDGKKVQMNRHFYFTE